MTEATRAGFAPAKVNLYLHVTGRRPDGYHVLDSLVAFAEVGDTITATFEDQLSLSIEGPFARAIPAGPENLVLRAADCLRQAVGRPELGARMALRKILPVAAGIGGGSADAAAVLRLLHDLWALDLPHETQHALAARVGADVPVCLAGQPSRVSGIGEGLTPAPALPSLWLVLVNPGVPLSTASVFAGIRRFNRPAPPMPRRIPDLNALVGFLSHQRNDLEPLACGLAPVIGDALASLRTAPECRLARMSGSGATCFGLFSGRHVAEAAAQRISHGAPDWWVAAAPLCATPHVPRLSQDVRASAV